MQHGIASRIQSNLAAHSDHKTGKYISPQPPSSLQHICAWGYFDIYGVLEGHFDPLARGFYDVDP